MDTVRTAAGRGTEVNPTTRAPRRPQPASIKTIEPRVLPYYSKALLYQIRGNARSGADS